MIKLENKTILITGPSSGFGEQFAKQMAEKGANLVMVARSTDKLEAIKNKISEKNKTRIDVIFGDLGKPETPLEIFNKLKEMKISVDILVNNAGFGHWGYFEATPYEKNFQMNMLNISSLVSMCHLFIPAMLDKKDGGIINVASTAGFQPVPYMANYAATKAFVLNFSLGLWQEYKEKGVTVTALCPGYSRTGFQKIAGMPKKFEKTLAEPDMVVREGIEAFINRKPLIIPKMHRDFLQFTLSKFIPLKTRLKITGDIFKP